MALSLNNFDDAAGELVASLKIKSGMAGLPPLVEVSFDDAVRCLDGALVSFVGLGTMLPLYASSRPRRGSRQWGGELPLERYGRRHGAYERQLPGEVSGGR